MSNLCRIPFVAISLIASAGVLAAPAVAQPGYQHIGQGCFEGLDICSDAGIPPYPGQKWFYGCPLGFSSCPEILFPDVDVNGILFSLSAPLYALAGPYMSAVCAPLGGGMPLVYLCYDIHCQPGELAVQFYCLQPDNTHWCDVYIQIGTYHCIERFDSGLFGGPVCVYPVQFFCFANDVHRPCVVYAMGFCTYIPPCYQWDVHPPDCTEPTCPDPPYCNDWSSASGLPAPPRVAGAASNPFAEENLRPRPAFAWPVEPAIPFERRQQAMEDWTCTKDGCLQA